MNECSGRRVEGDELNDVSFQEDWDAYKTLSAAMRRFEEGLEMTRLTMLGPTYREKLTADLEVITERVQDFTDSAYTSHEHRESILLLCDRVKLELNQLLRIGLSMVSATFVPCRKAHLFPLHQAPQSLSRDHPEKEANPIESRNSIRRLC